MRLRMVISCLDSGGTVTPIMDVIPVETLIQKINACFSGEYSPRVMLPIFNRCAFFVQIKHILITKL